MAPFRPLIRMQQVRDPHGGANRIDESFILYDSGPGLERLLVTFPEIFIFIILPRLNSFLVISFCFILILLCRMNIFENVTIAI